MPDLNDFATGPDVAHAAVAQAALDAIAQLADHLEQLADSFLLGQTAADFAQTVLTNFGTLSQAVTDQATTLATLQQTVTDLQTTVAGLQTSVSDLQATVTSQGAAITANEQAIADLQTRVTALENPTPAA